MVNLIVRLTIKIESPRQGGLFHRELLNPETLNQQNVKGVDILNFFLNLRILIVLPEMKPDASLSFER